MYFKNFPIMFYQFDIGVVETSLVVKDITRNIRFRRDVLANISVYDEYDILDNETPEHIAERIYGNPNYHWIVMLQNERFDYRADFPLSNLDMEKHIESKYGNTKYDIHHYVNDAGYTVDAAHSTGSITNYDYEYTHNESKRRIKLVPKIMIDKILANFKELI